MVEVYLSIGSNLGDRAGYLKNGVAALRSNEEVSVKRVSPVYRTSPVGPVEQSDFFNAIVELETSMGPERLLEILMRIERRYGRVRDKAWWPRTLDIDIILFGGENWSSPNLEIPHPRALDRAFVLRPLMDLAPKASIEDSSVEEALSRVDTEGVDRLVDFEKIQSVGILGASTNPDRYAYRAQELLVQHGHSVFPISLREEAVLGVPCGRSILDRAERLDTLTLYLSPSRQSAIVDDIIRANPARVIFNPGTESNESLAKFEGAGISCAEACTLVMLHTDQF